MLNALVRGAVFAQADAVVRKDVDDALLHERSHANGIAAVVAKGEEGAAIRDVAAMQSQAVHDGCHAKLAHAVVDVAANFADTCLCFHVCGQYRVVQVHGNGAVVVKAQR